MVRPTAQVVEEDRALVEEYGGNAGSVAGQRRPAPPPSRQERIAAGLERMAAEMGRLAETVPEDEDG